MFVPRISLYQNYLVVILVFIRIKKKTKKKHVKLSQFLRPQSLALKSTEFPEKDHKCEKKITFLNYLNSNSHYNKVEFIDEKEQTTNP